MGNFKILGLATLAALALSVNMTSTASADFITTNNGTTILTAEATETQLFKTSANIEVKCTTVAFDGTIVGMTAETVTVEPTYSACTITIPGIATKPAFVDSNGCHYLFTTNTSVHILCPPKKKIVITAELVSGVKSECLEIGEQTPTIPEVHYINNALTGNQMDTEIESTVSGITYNKTGPCGTTTQNDASYSGKVTVKGHDSVTRAQVGVTKVS